MNDKLLKKVNTGIATVLSGVFPGLGQLYNGELVKGFIFSICGIILYKGVWFVFNAAMYVTYFKYSHFELPSEDSMVIALVYAMVWANSIFDAHRNAKLE